MTSKEIVKALRRGLFSNTLLQMAADEIEKLESKTQVRHGQWQQNPYHKTIYFCSECGRHIEDGSNKLPYENFPYCHCGAKMDGERKENK